MAKNAKKAAAPKPTKVAKPAKAKKSSAKFVSFSITAVIPVMSYGNIQPKIEVQAKNYDDAKAFVMPLIADLFAEYSESKPTFLGKVKVVEKRVVAVAVVPVQPAPVGQAAQTPTPPVPAAQDVPAPQATASAAPVGPKPDAVLKAEKAIGLAATAEAAVLIQDQIEKSVKIPPEFKPDLITLVLQKRSDLK